jgi:hypothetical protein
MSTGGVMEGYVRRKPHTAHKVSVFSGIQCLSAGYGVSDVCATLPPHDRTSSRQQHLAHTFGLLLILLPTLITPTRKRAVAVAAGISNGGEWMCGQKRVHGLFVCSSVDLLLLEERVCV